MVKKGIADLISDIDALIKSGGSGDLAATKLEVDEILDLTRYYLAPTVGAAEADLFVDDTPGENKKGISIKIDLSTLEAGDTFIIREKYRIEDGGAMIQFSLDVNNTYSDAQTPTGIVVHLEPYRHGAEVVAIKTAGTDRVIKGEAFVEE